MAFPKIPEFKKPSQETRDRAKQIAEDPSGNEATRFLAATLLETIANCDVVYAHVQDINQRWESRREAESH